MTAPDYQVRNASSADLDAFYGLCLQVRSVHVDAGPAFFRPPEKDDAFQQYFESLLGDPDQHLLFACLDGVEVGFD